MQGRTLWRFGILLALGLFAGAACSDEDPAPNGPSDAGTAAGDGSVAADAASQGRDAAVAPDASVAADGSTGGGDASSIVDDCDPLNPVACMAPTTKCVVENPTPMGGTLCVEPSPNDPALGQECTGQDCQAGLACVRSTTSSTLATCSKVCNFQTGAGCESLGQEFECRIRLTGTNWGACAELPPVCDPFQQNCATDQACQPFARRTGTWEWRCRTAGPGDDGDACGSAAMGAGCQRGYVCVGDPQGGGAACRKICQSTMDCTGQMQCSGSVMSPSFQYCQP